MEQRDVFARLAQLASTASTVAVATVVRAFGSTPRHVGAKMVVLEDGSFFGTVGGGCGEAEVWQEARRLLAQGGSATVNVDLTEDPDAGGEKICGGRMDVFVDLWTQEDRAALAPVIARLDAERGLCLATVIAWASPSPSRRMFACDDGWTQGTLGSPGLDAHLRDAAATCIAQRRSHVATVTDAGLMSAGRSPRDEAPQIFVEVIERPPRLVIAGAGHCALPLSRIGRMLGFDIVILDDRPECATGERFPDASRILVGDLGVQIDALALDADSSVVLVTRGHKQDEEILRRIVHLPLAYIGMIGSRRRIRAVFADMERDGYDPAHLDRVHAPIGLDIGAETPEEIAVSILGEIIRVRKGRGDGRSLALRDGRARARVESDR